MTTPFETHFAPFENWVMPQNIDWLILLLLGFTGGISNVFYVSAFQNAEISLLAPFDYSIFFWAILLGGFFFGELPELHVWIGAVLIIATGVFLAKNSET